MFWNFHIRNLEAPSVKFIVILELPSTISMLISLPLNLSMYHPNLELAIGLWNAYLSQKLVFHSVDLCRAVGARGPEGHEQVFGLSVNPILTRRKGSGYAHLITTRSTPSDFQTFIRPCHVMLDCRIAASGCLVFFTEARSESTPPTKHQRKTCFWPCRSRESITIIWTIYLTFYFVIVRLI